MTREKTWAKVRAACRGLVENRKRVTVKAVADIAGISRSTIYNDPKLKNFALKYEKSFYYQRGQGEAHGSYQKGYDAGYAAGLRDARGASRRAGHSHEWARGVLHISGAEQLTADLVKKKFRQLSHLLHPDKGGVTDLQRQLIEAYELLKRAVGD